MKNSDPLLYIILGKTKNFIVSAIDMSLDGSFELDDIYGSADTFILDLNDNSINGVFLLKESGKPSYYSNYNGKCY